MLELEGCGIRLVESPCVPRTGDKKHISCSCRLRDHEIWGTLFTRGSFFPAYHRMRPPPLRTACRFRACVGARGMAGAGEREMLPMLRPGRTIRHLGLWLLGLVVVLLSPAAAGAAVLTWGSTGAGGNGTWDSNVTANWFDGEAAVKWPAPGGTDDDAVFAGSGGTVAVTAGGVEVNDIAFTAGGYVISGGPLTLAGAGAPGIGAASGSVAEIASVIAGSSGLTKALPGTLVLSGNNTFAGNVTVGAGTLRLAHSGALGAGAKTFSMQGSGLVLQLSNSISLGSGITLNVSSNSFDGGGISSVDGINQIRGPIRISTGNPALNISSAAGSTLTITGNITLVTSARPLHLGGNSTGANAISGIIGGGALPLTKQGTGTWVLSGANTYTGNTTITSGKLIGVAGGSCASSPVILAATANSTAVLGISVPNNTKQWTCASLTVNNAGTASDLLFDFGTITPGTTLAPLKITGAASFLTAPVLVIKADSNLGPVGAKFPLITWGSATGTLPTTFTIATSNPTAAHLEVAGNTLYLVIDDYTPTLSDSQLFSALDLNHPGLESVKSLAQAGDYPAAKAALATYLRTRTNVNWYFDWRHPTTSVSYNKASADSAVAGTFSFGGYTHTFPGGAIDWNYTPNAASQWTSLMNRMNFWNNVGATYWGTGDESYAQAWVRQFRSWVTQCPLPAGTQSILAPWATIQAAERMANTWPDSFFRYILSPSVSDDDLVIFLKSSIEHGRYLRQWSTTTAMNMNIHAWELCGLYTVATVFPELNEAAEWRSYSAQDMFAQETAQFYPDGVHIELSPRYHIGTLGSILDVHDLAALNSRVAELPDGYLAGLEKPFEFLLGNSAPNRLMPPFNDCGSANENTMAWLDDGYSYFPYRTDFLWTSGGGTPPAKVSWNFPWAGYAVMRSSWDTTANFLCFDAGPLGSSGHRHEDKLNVVLWAFGREILFDSGGGSYESGIWRTWGTSSYSHNCITVDGLDQEGGDGGYATTDADYQAQGPIDMRWESGADHDFAAGVYNRGYGGNYNNRPAAQTRRVLFVKPDIYVVADTLVPANASSHTYQARWHLLTPNTAFDPATKVVTTTDAGVANLAVVPCLSAGLAVENISARTSISGNGTAVLSEMLGWDQPDLSTTRNPATTATHTLSGTGTKHFLTVFLPLKPGQVNPVVSVTATGTTSAEIVLADGRRLLVAADPDPSRGLKLTEVLPGGATGRYAGAGNQPPVISGLSNASVSPGALVGPVPFTVTDNSPVSGVAISVRSLNQALVPDANLTLGGSGSNRTLTAALAPSQTGTATVVVSALDPDGSTASSSFEITAAYPPGSAPAAAAGNVTTLPDTSVDIDLRTLGSDAETPSASLRFAVGNPGNGTVTLLPDGHTARFTPAAGFIGPANFQFSVADLGEDPRTYCHYAFEPPDDAATGKIVDFSAKSRAGDILTTGNGTAQLVADAPAALAGSGTQAIELVENGDFNGAQVRRLINAHDLDMNDHSWTFACWFKRANTTNDDFLFHLGSGNGFGSEEELQLACQAGSNRVALNHWNGTAADLSIVSSATAAPGTWNHVAVTYTRTAANTGTVSLYLNGAPVGSASNVPFRFNQSYPAILGGHSQTTAAVSRWFNGRLDDAVIFTEALGSTEIARLSTMSATRFGGLTTNSAVSVAVNFPTRLEDWRFANFGTAANAGSAADSADPDGDGETNWIEFATGQGARDGRAARSAVRTTASGLEFTYTRSRAALEDGLRFAVEFSDALLQASWTSLGAGEVVSDGPVQTVRAIAPNAPPDGRRFLRLKITSP